MKIFEIMVIIFIISIVNFSCDSTGKDQKAAEDSLFLQNAYAQTDSGSQTAAAVDIMQSRQNAITRAVSKVSPAVVGISVIQIKKYVQRSPFLNDPYWQYFFPELFRDRVYEQRVQNLGSGFLISHDGYILTNDHVAGDGVEIIVTLPGGERHKAELVGTDKVSDITLLKIDGQNFPLMEFGNSDDLIVGEWVIALGNPFGLFELSNQPTVTVGVISAINRDWGRIPETGRVYMDMIQTDAAINHGNSGGPLVNSYGQVIGMNTFIYTGSRYEEGFVGIGFAIPINKIRTVVKQIKEKGGVNRNYWMGFKVQDLNSLIIRALDLKVDHGVIVTQVEQGSSADKAGMKTEDVIIGINDKPVADANNMVEIMADMDLQVGNVVVFRIIRNGKEQNLNMKLLEK
jgi:serine protease Do